MPLADPPLLSKGNKGIFMNIGPDDQLALIEAAQKARWMAWLHEQSQCSTGAVYAVAIIVFLGAAGGVLVRVLAGW